METYKKYKPAMWSLVANDYGYENNEDSNDDDDIDNDIFLRSVFPDAIPSSSSNAGEATRNLPSGNYVSNSDLKGMLVEIKELCESRKTENENAQSDNLKAIVVKIKEVLKCVVCMDSTHPDNMSFCESCGRFIGCFMPCISNLDKCPLCREEFPNVILVPFRIPGLIDILND